MRIERQSESHEVLRREVTGKGPRQEGKKGSQLGETSDKSSSTMENVRMSIAFENRRAAASTILGMEQARGAVQSVVRQTHFNPGKVLQAQADLRPENVLHLLR